MISSKTCAALIMSVSLAAALASTAALGGQAFSAGARHSPSHSSLHHPFVARALRHHKARQAVGIWPNGGGFFYAPGATNAEPGVVVTEPRYRDYDTCTYNIPWDWAHRCPPLPSEPPVIQVIVPRAPGCAAQTVTVPRGDGKEQTVTIARC